MLPDPPEIDQPANLCKIVQSAKKQKGATHNSLTHNTLTKRRFPRIGESPFCYLANGQ